MAGGRSAAGERRTAAGGAAARGTAAGGAAAAKDAPGPDGPLSRIGRAADPRATLVLWGTRAVYVGPTLGLGAHRSAVAVVAVGLDAPFGVAREPAAAADDAVPGAARWCRTALIPPRTLHRLVPRGRMAFVYLDALGPDLASVLAGAGARAERAGAVCAAFDLAGEAELIACLAGADAGLTPWPAALGRVAALLGAGRAPGGAARDPATAAAARRLYADPGGCPPLAGLAAAAGVSPARFARRFGAAVGVPFRRYRTWCRLAAAARAAARGAPLTRAALGAGFAGSAHLSAACRAMFGLSPTRLLWRRLTLVDCGPAPAGAPAEPRSHPPAR